MSPGTRHLCQFSQFGSTRVGAQGQILGRARRGRSRAFREKTGNPPPNTMQIACFKPAAPVEILEARIAPAALSRFYIDTTNHFALTGTGGKTKTDEVAAATAAGATEAYLFNPGETLILHQPNGLPDITLFTVTGGQAYIFLTDLSHNGQFDLNEITGLSVGGKFKGMVNDDIHGPVTTTLGTTKVARKVIPIFTGAQLQPSSIDGLTVNGGVSGDILAGGPISNVNILGGINGLSVHQILTGNNAAGMTESYNGGGTPVGPSTFSAQPGSGGDISGVTLSQGVSIVHAGDGTNGGGGGNVLNVAIGAAGIPGTLLVQAGNGSDGAKGNGGGGGSIGGINAQSSGGTISILAGSGGLGGSTNGAHGGQGGSLGGVQITATGEVTAAVFTSGAGGAGTAGSGGAGGDVSLLVLQSGNPAAASVYDSVSVTAGAGADAGGKSGNGGSGGSILAPNVGEVGQHLALTAGAGGTGIGSGAGGQGGSVSGLKISKHVTASVVANVASALSIDITGGGGGGGAGGAGGNGGR